ncbi:hypothetical protein GGTG_04792 [Gaeumannomyces tritici R3-111a-1]|uniref:Uncharacterized protein n=1 Tax=Gaeumannomyces tritici (strain R3-111a-1) TaxID=644352 RepID=J3NU41_GAET3|nr:hypothetical protein GGTG_04792 [Gaeumannomyces tritici R3-111a-1]EJT79708.1 hypothetical protein GGTG_04792 [Gaeumannomyces tritici R3-111a-1]
MDDQEVGPGVHLLRGMLVIGRGKRLTTRKGRPMKCIRDRLFTQRAVGGLVVCAMGGDQGGNADVAGRVE